MGRRGERQASTGQDAVAQPDIWERKTQVEEWITPGLYAEYFEALLAGNKEVCVKTVQYLLDREIDLYDLYVHLFQRSLYEVGDLWERNRVSVAIEHLATTITESLLTLVYPRIFAAEHIDKKAVVACVANEYHQIGAKMVADVFELNGWDGYFLGANTPPESLLAFVQEKRPHVLGLSLSVYFNMDTLCRLLEIVRGAFRDLPVLVGGQAFRWGGADRVTRYPGVQQVSTLKELESFIRQAS
jgi:methanogenic corrinoid protein MtbC1